MVFVASCWHDQRVSCGLGKMSNRGGRKRKRAERFLNGTAISAHRPETSLETSLSSSDLLENDSIDSETELEVIEMVSQRKQKREEECQRGCPAILKKLVKTFAMAGKHTGKVAQHRRNSYLNPKNAYKLCTSYLDVLKMATESKAFGHNLCIIISPALKLRGDFPYTS